MSRQKPIRRNRKNFRKEEKLEVRDPGGIFTNRPDRPTSGQEHPGSGSQSSSASAFPAHVSGGQFRSFHLAPNANNIKTSSESLRIRRPISILVMVSSPTSHPRRCNLAMRICTENFRSRRRLFNSPPNVFLRNPLVPLFLPGTQITYSVFI